MKKYIIAMTGASGSIYFKRLSEVLSAKSELQLHLIATDNGKAVMAHELGIDYNGWAKELADGNENIRLEAVDNLFGAIASGSYGTDGMVVAPCSMGTLAEISHGISKNLLTRAADVAIKEKKPLIIVPRETPLSAIHLENMLKLANLGVTILPAMPGFYHEPATMEELVDFIVGKILDQLGVDNNLYEKWEN